MYIYIYMYMYVYTYVYIYIYIYTHYSHIMYIHMIYNVLRTEACNSLPETEPGYSAEGGAVGGGVQWMGVELYSDIVCNIM